MRRFITRHSQIPDGSSYAGGHLFPEGETLISELGSKQARLLGIRLREMGFSGVILSSPYVRTMLTAEIIARETGSKIIPFSPIHEIFRKRSQIDDYRGMNAEEIKNMFSCVHPDFKLAEHWWPTEIETQDTVDRRVAVGVKLAEELYGNGDILYVAHGASCDGLVKAYKIQKKRYPLMFNCSLSYVDSDAKKQKRVYCDCTHLPYSMTTSNFMYKRDFDTEAMEKKFDGEIALPDWVKTVGRRVLHIGDTESQSYPFFRALIEAVRPHVIIHTGDLADEVKVGRIPAVHDEYLHKIKVMCNMMAVSGAEELIVVPGNNDVESDILALLPNAHIVKPGETVWIDGVECQLSHSAKKVRPGYSWSFYGHGFTDDTWDKNNNREGEECRFNAYNGAVVCCPSENKFAVIEIPKIDLSIM